MIPKNFNIITNDYLKRSPKIIISDLIELNKQKNKFFKGPEHYKNNQKQIKEKFDLSRLLEEPPVVGKVAHQPFLDKNWESIERAFPKPNIKRSNPPKPLSTVSTLEPHQNPNDSYYGPISPFPMAPKNLNRPNPSPSP